MNKIKILLVEDEPEIRLSLAEILESDGFEIFQAEDGKQGLEVFLDKRPDLIISDVMMPIADGHQLLESIRNNKEIDNSNIPFIFLSALGQRDDILKGSKLGASDYLVKPVDFEMLDAKIKEKTSSLKKQKEVFTKNISNLKTQISNIAPNEMLQYVDMINNISKALRDEIYGPLPHKKYLDDINKIYFNSIKLKTIVNNFLSGSAISDQIDVEDEILEPLQLIQDFIGGLNNKFKSQIKISYSDNNDLPNIKINKIIFNEIIKKLIGGILKLKEDSNIEIAIFNDHFDQLIFIIYPKARIEKDILENQILNSISSDVLSSQGLHLEVSDSNDNSNIIFSVPNYRVVKKDQ
ncbi:MAG: CheY-like chemotaxis protein [Rickettsiales bacterium]|jgi:CheY-like chemotaxis protein